MLDKSDHDLLTELHTTIMGCNGNPGLCDRYERLAKDYYSFKRYVLMVVAFIAGTGAIGISLWEIIKW